MDNSAIYEYIGRLACRRALSDQALATGKGERPGSRSAALAVVSLASLRRLVAGERRGLIRHHDRLLFGKLRENVLHRTHIAVRASSIHTASY